MSDNRDLLIALRLGETAALNMMIFAPLKAEQEKWKNAAEMIREQRVRVQLADKGNGG